MSTEPIKGELFLIEFLVDNVSIYEERMIPEGIITKMFISFKILDLPPFKIYQDCACSATGPQVFNKGKSCLFALPDAALRKPLPSFPTEISVWNELPPGHLPDVMLIGSLTGHQAEICRLVNLVLSRRVVYDVTNSGLTTKNTYPISRPTTGKLVGEAALFVRVSGLGARMVTQFQRRSCDRELYLFKRTDSDRLFRFERVAPAPGRCWRGRSDGGGEAAVISAAVRDRRRPRDGAGEDECAPCCPEEKAAALGRKPAVRKCGCPAQPGDSWLRPDKHRGCSA